VNEAQVKQQFWQVVLDLPDPKTWPGKVTYGFIFFFTAWLVGRAVRLAIHGYLDKAEKAGADPTGVRFLGKLANVGIYVIAFVSYCKIVPGLQELGTAGLASVGAVSVVVGLAAQTTLGNLVSGISLVLYRPFKIGDRIQVSSPTGAEIGLVESINLGYTILRTDDQRRLVIPNSTMSTQTSINLTQTRKGAACNVSITIAANTDVAPARTILTDIAKAHAKTVALDACNITAVSGAGTTLTLNVWCKDGDTVGPLRSDILETAKKQFDAAGIKISRWNTAK
jgi:small-conductance mechanosensitive channel